MTAGTTEQIYDLTLTTEGIIKTVNITGQGENTYTVPNVFGKSVKVISCFDNTTGDAVTATVSSAVVTLDAAGSLTTEHNYQLTYTLV